MVVQTSTDRNVWDTSQKSELQKEFGPRLHSFIVHLPLLALWSPQSCPFYLRPSVMTSYLWAWLRVFCSMRLKVSRFLFSLSRRNEWKICVSNTWEEATKEKHAAQTVWVLCVFARVHICGCKYASVPSCKRTGLWALWFSGTPHC